MAADYYTRDGAERLAARIKEYWRERGGIVTPHVRRLKYFESARSAPYIVETDMVDGLPTRWEQRPRHTKTRNAYEALF